LYEIFLQDPIYGCGYRYDQCDCHPRPFEDFKSFDMDMKEQVPRKFVSNILLVKIEAKNNTSGLIAGALIC